MTTLASFLFVLGVLVFIHELGHFLLARWNGVRVLTFSLGFGPKLLKVQRGDTEYAISAIPRVIKETMDAHDVHDVTTVEMVRRVDKWARECARHTAQALELNA